MRRTIAAALAATLLAGPSTPTGESASGTVPVAGLGAPVTLVTDRYGVPHVQAHTLSDLYLAWGWVTARDRLWQLIETRAAAEGTRHRWLGNEALNGDGGVQLFRVRERAEAIWRRDREDPALRLAIERYSAGVNAYLGECRRGNRPWPRELARLRDRPRDWRPEDSVMLLIGLGFTLDLDLPELAEARIVREHGADWARERRRFEGQWTYATAPGSPTRAASGARRTTWAGGTLVLPRETVAAAAALAARFPAHDDGALRASNEFVVGPERTASGRPILENDPHLGLGTPGPFHVLHLSVEGTCDAIGAAVPGLPAIVSGRNTRCAWGVTALSADVVDVYADTLSADGRSVRWRNGWTRIIERPYALAYRVLGIPIPVLPFAQVRRYTPHGPVIVFDRDRRIALSVRWSALEDSSITLARLVGVERSMTADEVTRRFRSLVTPTINVVAADVDGHALYQATGLVPKRWDDPGPGPLPSDGAHEWAGFIPADSMPAFRVPRGGFAVNSNNRPTDATPYAWPRYDWAHDRALRIAERLAGDVSLTPADAWSVQNDCVSRPAKRFVPALLACADSLPERCTPRMRAALDTLRRWDFVARRSRVAPTIYRGWFGALVRRSRTEGLPGLTLAGLTGRAGDAFRAPGSESHERPAEAAVAALTIALDTLTAKLGPDPAAWTWGRAHRARFEHALSDLDGRSAWEPATLAIDGDNGTPSVGASRLPWSVEVTHGPVFRHVCDLARSDLSWGVIPPWNSAAFAPGGDLDLRSRWANHAWVPLRLDWTRIRADAFDTRELVPVPARAR